MKKALLIAAAVMFVASSVVAVDLPPVGYIGVYGDAGHTLNSVCPAPYAGFPAWIMCLPPAEGLQAAEFALNLPAGQVISLAAVKNPNITVELGALTTGISIAFGETTCQLDWVYLYQLTLMMLGPGPSRVDIIPHPGVQPVPAYQFASCALGYPIVPCIFHTPLYLCQSGPLGVQESNWGAIKSLF
jgi:hypothetical protein